MSQTLSPTKKVILSTLLATCISILISLALILLFAFVIKWFHLPDSAIVPVNYVIKVVSLFIACLFVTRNQKNGLKKGVVVGLLYTLLSTLIFSLLAMQFTFSLSFIYDLLIGMAMGGILGIIAVNIPRKNYIEETL